MPQQKPEPHRLTLALWCTLPFAVATWLRWHNLGRLPPFVDEGANILTGLDPRIRAVFHPLEQGRPLLVWLFRPAEILPSDLLWASRSMAALSGLATMAAIGWILAQLGGWRQALGGLWLWACLPLAVWHERLALQDPFVTAALAWATAFLIAGHRPVRGALAFWGGAGLLFGTAFLLKISATFALVWLGLVYFALRRKNSLPFLDRRLLVLLSGIVLPIAFLGSDLFRLGSGLDNIDALPSSSQWAGGFLQRAYTWLGWYLGYDGWPLVCLLVLGLLVAARLTGRQVMIWSLAAGWIATLVVAAIFYNQSYARYALPDHLPLVLALALALGSAAETLLGRIALGAGVVALVRYTFIDWTIGVDPANAVVPAVEVTQYVTGPWSGRGTDELKKFLTDYADRHGVQCLVLTHRGLRPGCYALMLAEWGDARIAVMPFTIYEPAELAATRSSLRSAAGNRPVAFFVLYEGSLYPAHPWVNQPGSGLELASSIDRGGGEDFKLYQLVP